MSTRCIGLSLVFVLCVAGASSSAEKEKGKKTPPPAVDPVEVEFFAAAQSGQIKVQVVAPNYSQMLLRVQNTSETPLRVLLPDTIAAVPAARRQVQQALQQNGMPPALANNYGPYQGGSQGLGGSLAGPWAQDPNSVAQRGDRNGQEKPQNGDAEPKPMTWTLAPGQLIQLQIPCFCLEFGKPDPNRKIPYEMVQLQDLNDQPAVQELLKRFAQGDIDQRIAQLAAWHVANGTPWQMLAQIKLPRNNGRGGPVSQRELMAAKMLAESLPSYGQQRSLGDR